MGEEQELVIPDDYLHVGEIYVPDASSGDGFLRTNEQMEEWAKILNCYVLKPTNKQLFIDIDTDEQFEQFKKTLHVLRNHYVCHREFEIAPSKSGLPHRHVIVNLYQAQPLMVRIALQAALGSDPMREVLSIKRALDEEENVVIFFEKKD